MLTLFNILWLILGGGLIGLVWFLGGALMAVSIIGLPWARACFTIGRLVLWPFGYESRLRETKDMGTGTLGVLGNIVWLAIGHISIALTLFLSIIGIPFALQHIKFVPICLMPIGQQVVKKGL